MHPVIDLANQGGLRKKKCWSKIRINERNIATSIKVPKSFVHK